MAVSPEPSRVTVAAVVDPGQGTLGAQGSAMHRGCRGAGKPGPGTARINIPVQRTTARAATVWPLSRTSCGRAAGL